MSTLPTLPSLGSYAPDDLLGGSSGNSNVLANFFNTSNPIVPNPQTQADTTLNQMGAQAEQLGNQSLISGLSTARIVTGIIGILCIGAGLLMFKQSQTIINTVGKVAAKGAAIA